jgi:peptide/nickel transport system permease protein
MLITALNRLLASAASLIGLMLLVFFLARLTGDPSVHYLPIDATAQMRADFARLNGLDAPLLVQFAKYVQGLLVFDFGVSMRQGRPAIEIVLRALPNTLILTAVTIGIAVVVAVVAGALAARKPNGIADRCINIVALLGASAPNFWLAIVGILVFAVWFRLLPTSGTGTAAHWVMPVAVLVLRPAGLLAQVVRGAMINALSSGYARTARAKGASTFRVIFVHALRNIALPVLTVAGDQTAGIVGGAVVVETVFSLNGVGKLMMDSIVFRDFPVLQAAILMTACLILLMNIVLDILYGLLDPRTRTAGR